MFEVVRQNIQVQIDAKKDISERRKCRQFSTPFSLAKEIAHYGITLLNDEAISFLEPSIGTGVFYSTLTSENEKKIIVKATGIEIDSAYITGAKSVWYDSTLNLYHADFTQCIPDSQYNLVLTNPPYIRHHYLTQAEKSCLYERVKNETGIQVSGLAGIYCYFVLLTHKWLAPDAICGWLLPSEFMDVNYGNSLKKYLLEQVHLLRIHRYNPKNSKFDDALVSSCVVWFKNEVVNYDYSVEFSYDGTHEKPKNSKKIKKSSLVLESKWTRFPEKGIRNSEDDTATIGDYFTIQRGLATGDNSFFVLERSKIKELGLDMEYFKPILPSPRYLKTDYIKSDEFGNPQISPQYYLLDCALTEEEIQEKHPALWEYLQKGIPNTSEKYLCKSRKKWYWQEHRNATQFLCSYMGRGNQDKAPIRFILNLSEAIVTNSYLMLYPKETLRREIMKNPNIAVYIWREFKAISAREIEEEGRVYGGGLKKIEPKELAKVPCDGLRYICELA